MCQASRGMWQPRDEAISPPGTQKTGEPSRDRCERWELPQLLFKAAVQNDLAVRCNTMFLRAGNKVKQFPKQQRHGRLSWVCLKVNTDFRLYQSVWKFVWNSNCPDLAVWPLTTWLSSSLSSCCGVNKTSQRLETVVWTLTAQRDFDSFTDHTLIYSKTTKQHSDIYPPNVSTSLSHLSSFRS